MSCDGELGIGDGPDKAEVSPPHALVRWGVRVVPLN